MVTLACGICPTSMLKIDLECYCLGVAYSFMSRSGGSFSLLFSTRAFSDSWGRRSPYGLTVALYILSSIEMMEAAIIWGNLVVGLFRFVSFPPRK